MKLVADVGGTKTLLGVVADGALTDVQRIENDTRTTFPVLLDDYLATLSPATRRALDGACLALAAPIAGPVVRLTNRQHWRVDTREISGALGGAPVRLVNDFAAMARGLDALTPADLVTLQPGSSSAAGLRLCLGPGTGFGVAALAHGEVIVSEGGHSGFAPCDPQQADLWRFLGGEHRRVTIERLCSGPGLLAIYRYCLMRAGQALPADLAAAEVTRRAREDADPCARHALRLFTRILGGAAGDLALTFLARGGVFLTGGIVPQLLPELTSEAFAQPFNDKAEHSRLMREMAVHVVTRTDLALLGAARLAADGVAVR